MSPPTLCQLHAELGARLERLIRIQSESYPSHWKESEKREMAEKHLFADLRGEME